MKRLLFVLLSTLGAVSLAQAQSRGGYHGAAPGVGAHHRGYVGYRHGYPGYRPGYPGYRPGWGWGGAYWGPRVGFYYGGPGYWGGWPYASYAWGYPYAYSYSTVPMVVTTPSQPQVFIQQAPTASAAPQPASPSGYWYYCRQPAGYFPYVKDCNQDWLKVVPQPPGEHPSAPHLAQ